MTNQILIPSGSSLVSPQALDSITVSGVEQQRVRLLDSSGNPIGGANNALSVGMADATASGTIAMSAITNAVSVSTAGMGTVGIGITGTWTGTLIVEGQYGDGNWLTINIWPTGSGYGNEVTTSTVNANFVADCAAYSSVRVRCSVTGTGTATIEMRASAPASVQKLGVGFSHIGAVAVDTALPASSNIIGQVNALRPGSPVTFSATTAEAGVAPTASSALISLNVGRAGASTAAATTIALTAGKTLRVQSMLLSVSPSTTTNIRVVATLRYNSGGSATASSPAVGQVVAGSPAAVAATGGQAIADFGDGLDLAAGATPAQIAVSIIGSSATGLCWVSLHGYEY